MHTNMHVHLHACTGTHTHIHTCTLSDAHTSQVDSSMNRPLCILPCHHHSGEDLGHSRCPGAMGRLFEIIGLKMKKENAFF